VSYFRQKSSCGIECNIFDGFCGRFGDGLGLVS
jgi:hypothetical protein